ncbi:S8 family serine peptidase [Arvimicrobium flavum]|uniref:S8 family serine peptidase n=1 Tax=Arvimicrobium flavum TaxID=3393320 RepID=UPI00237C3ADA|nr:S8 family serine peptidase [Mesorhizobium shangrilense]
MARSDGLLVKVRGDGAGFAANTRSLRAGKVEAEAILSIPAASEGGMGVAGGQGATWLKISAKSVQSENPWDNAHRIAERREAFAAAGGPSVLAVEPDFVQQWDYKDGRGDPGMALSAAPACTFDDQDSGGGKAILPGKVAWNAGPGFSQFAAARTKVGSKQSLITVAHLDTGFDPAHRTVPANLAAALQRNFVNDGRPANDATDHAPAGTLTSNPGHGTGTLSLLAGNRLAGVSPGWEDFSDFVGGAPGVSVIPVRIANWVVRFTTSTMVQGFDYARAKGAHVLSMSMGGLSSSALVDAINLGYDAGLVMVTAAGNNFAGVLSSIVFPARYKRVLAACGVMADGRAYSGLGLTTMQGNFGPPSKMDTAIGAYTPNVPWAEIDCPEVVDMDGAGTSAATPQVAAAVALWLAQHWDTVKTYPQPWMRVEAVRRALFASAAKSTPKMGPAETFQKLGQGVVHASAALLQAPAPASQLRKLPPAEYSWPWANLLFGGGVSVAPGGALSQRDRMLVLELTQMAQRVDAVEKAMLDPDADPAQVSAAARNAYLEAALDEGNPSKPLKHFLEGILARPAAKPAKAPPIQTAPTIKRKPRPAAPPKRRLRIYALDPSVGTKLDSVSVHVATLSVPWDDRPATSEPLKPGPVGEYLEIVDIDPASNRVYDPVDLNDKYLLAQDGLQPSEGNPQFHQQMVYAVAMTTIGNFEQALGRRALWAPHYAYRARSSGASMITGYEVPRLRIYPHALRAENAYYSPDKKALLFGYFRSEGGATATTPRGSTVFSCLSSDIIAHEVSHALLDGLHRRFQEASPPDVPAFHEAFADIVALFQHFTLRELVSFEIGRVRGDLSAANLLSGLAAQFGEGSGRSGPLRDYANPKMADLDYDTTMEPHDRGSILVIAVYEAFLAIIARRTEDLVRLATGGTGVLPAGALHPGLVDRLTDDTVKTAKHMLNMCIRALDYCPAVDITFGDYLRALITADMDAFPEDGLYYRTAFMESFRKWKLLPRDVRTVSTETLAWDGPADPSPSWLRGLFERVDLYRIQKRPRSETFAMDERNRWALWTRMKRAFNDAPDLYEQFGLLPDMPRYTERGALLRPAEKGSSTFEVSSVRPTRRVEPDGSFRVEVVAVMNQRVPLRDDGTLAFEGVREGEAWSWFRGGATMILHPQLEHEEIRYLIVKNINSEQRRLRQAETASRNFMSPSRALYFGGDTSEPFALLHAHDEDDDHG